MGKISVIDWIKRKIASMGWRLFLWGNSITQEEYWQEIYEQEKVIYDDK